MPSSFWLAKTFSRYASQPSSNAPLYLSAHSFGHVVRRVHARRWQKYMKNGLLGATCLASAMNAMALSTRSGVRW